MSGESVVLSSGGDTSGERFWNWTSHYGALCQTTVRRVGFMHWECLLGDPHRPDWVTIRTFTRGQAFRRAKFIQGLWPRDETR